MGEDRVDYAVCVTSDKGHGLSSGLVDGQHN
jgi:hypothetical protein